MDALRSPPPFTFPPPAHASPPPTASQTLAAAFDYPVRQDSLAHRGSHHPSTSTSTASSSSSRGRGRGHALGAGSYASTSGSSAGTRSAYTSCTSDAFDEDARDDCDDERDYSDQGSVLDELYDELASFHPLDKDADSSPLRGCGQTNSTALARERTRYRSSASSYSPTRALNLDHKLLPGAFGNLSFEQRDSQLSLLASIAASPETPLDRCFCGNEAEEDSIYCGRACAQADALNALCGGGAESSGVEEAGAASSSSGSGSDGASLRSRPSSGLAGSGSESHYRRVEKEEARRAKERERQARREKKAGRKLGRSEAAAGLEGKPQNGQVEQEEEEQQRVVLPPPRTTSRSTRASSRAGAGTPSLSSSVSSLASSAQPSPISACFPASATASPFIVEPSSAAFEPPLRPCTPNPPHSNHQDAHLAGDIYSSYLTATPLANDKLRTPTQHPRGATPGSTLVTPRATFPRTPGEGDDDEDESPTQRGAGAAEGVGLRMLELCADEEDDERARGLEERDLVSPNPDEGGWGARDMRERMWARSGSASSASSAAAYGHTKGKLSFDDVVGILGA